MGGRKSARRAFKATHNSQGHHPSMVHRNLTKYRCTVKAYITQKGEPGNVNIKKACDFLKHSQLCLVPRENKICRPIRNANPFGYGPSFFVCDAAKQGQGTWKKFCFSVSFSKQSSLFALCRFVKTLRPFCLHCTICVEIICSS